jgi:predicted acetyltransferase
LKPVSWRDWAGTIERDGGARNPFLSLEERYAFWDVRVSFFWFLILGDVLVGLCAVLDLCCDPNLPLDEDHTLGV